MRIIALIFAAFMLATNTLFAQYRIAPVPIAPTQKQQHSLATKLQTYSLYTISSNQLSSWLKEDNFELTFVLPSQTIEWEVERNTMSLSPMFTAEEYTPNGVEILNDELTLLAYRGYKEGELKANAVITMTDLGLEINYNSSRSGTVRFASLYNLTYRPEDIDVYILYRYFDVFATQEGSASCQLDSKEKGGEPGTTIRESKLHNLKEGGEESFCILPISSYNAATRTTTTCRIFQIALDGDEEFRGNDAFGLLTFSRMFNNLMAAELPYFNEVDVSFQITRIRTFGGWGANGDPHPDDDFFEGNTFFQNRVEVYKDELVTLNAGATPHDYVFGFTGVVARAATSGGVLWGSSNGIGTACSNNSASGLATQEAFNDGIAAVNTAHEIGHGYDALHPYGGQCINECSPGGAPNSFMCRTACAAIGTQNLTTIANETQTAWTNFVNAQGPCFNNTDIGTINGPDVVCNSSATFNWDADNVASGSIWSFPNTTWTVGPGLSISNAFAYNATVTATTNSPTVSWIRMTLNQPTGCPIVLTKDIVVNAMPAFCSFNEVCDGNFFDFVDGQTLNGTTVSNFQCISGANCNSLVINNLGGGSSPLLNFSGTPGFYVIEYTLTNSCGTFTSTFWLSLIDCFSGGSGKEIMLPKNNNQATKRVTNNWEEGNNSVELSQLFVYPNPVHGQLSVKIQTQEDQRTEVVLFDSQGRKLKNAQVELLQGLNQVNLNIADLPYGVYTVVTQVDGILMSRRVIKQ